MSQRINNIIGQIQPNASFTQVESKQCAAAFPKKGDDTVIVSAVRTAIGRAKRGVFKDTYVEDLLAAVIKATIERTKIDPATLGDIVVGTVLGQGSQRANECRIGAFLAGIPDTVPLHTLNRQCSSGLQAIASVGAAIKSGQYEIGLACGVESMSGAVFKWEGSMNPKIFMNPQAKACLLPMGITSENVAARYNVTREEQDKLAVQSHQRAAAAIKSGRFKDEIIPVTVKVKDPKTGVEKEVVADTDDGCRPETTFESLSKLQPAFQKGGSTTAGNASQVSDGAAAVLVTSRAYAQKHGLPILGSLRSFAVAGTAPEVMGIGPAVAIPEALKKAGLTTKDIDLYEINEAFASQAAYSVKKLGLSWDNVNVNGGAIAIGHPLGCTGARATATLFSELKKRNQKLGVVSMCIGSGMGAAAVFERE